MDLDDFFAKKDRKKNKGKKFATADEIAKKLDEAGKRSEKLKKEKTNPEVDEQGNTVVQVILMKFSAFFSNNEAPLQVLRPRPLD